MIDIKDISGKILFSVQENDETVFVEELMSSDYIRLSWHSDKGDSIPVSSYIEYDGEKYRLLETYTPQMENEAEYVYSPKFDSRVIAWGKQIVPVYTYGTDGTTVKTREMDWEFTGSPADAMFMVKQAIKNETGEEWTVQLSDSLPATISISSQSASILSVLNSIADECETEWWTDKNTNTLYLSKCVKGDPITLEVGKQVGVPSVTDNSEGYYTRFYAFGSTRNIVQESLEGGASVNKRLTLDPVKYPYGYKDIRPGLSQEEVFVKLLYYDKIYPSSKLTISDVRARLRYRVDNEGNRIRIGGTDEEPVYEQYAIWYFQIGGFTFDSYTIIEGKNPSASFESGQLAGRDFELEYHEKAETVKDGNDVTPFEINAGDYEIIIDESTGSIVPGLSYIIPQDGDSVILYNIVMPDEYTKSAQDELEAELDKYIAKQDEDNRTYQTSSNPVYFYENKTDLSLGQSVTFVYGGMSVSTRIQSVEKRLDLPCYQDIGLGDKVLKGVIQKLKDDVAYTNQQIDIIKAFNELSVSLTNAYANAQREMIEGFAAIKKLWSLKEDDEGNQYAYTKLPIVGAAGMTLFAGDEIKVDSIFKGLPIDTETLQWVDGVLTVVGGTGGASNWDELEGKPSWITPEKPKYTWSEIEQKPSWITTEKPKYSYTEITGLVEELKKYVTLLTDQSVTGMKDFANGMKVSGVLFKVINGVLTLDCSIAVTGGITTHAIGEQTAATIMDGVAVDGITITKEDGMLKVVGGTGGASNWDELEGKPSWITDTKPTYAWGEIAQKPATLSGYGIQASDVLNTIKSVDGSGSGLDADTLDGSHRKNGKNGVPTIIKFPIYTEISPSASTDDYLNKIPGWTYNNLNTNEDDTLLLGIGHPNSRGCMLMHIYSKEAINSEGYPRYSSGLYIPLGNTSPYIFGTNDYVYYQNRIAFITSNVASATKLQTARTIWGQSFDGTANVTGSLTSVIDITGTGTFTGANIKATDSIYLNGIRLHKTAEGVITLEGNLAVTGGITQFAVNEVSSSTIMDGVVVDGTSIKKENGVLKVINAGGGEAGSVKWANIDGKPTTLAGYSITASDVLSTLKTVDGSGSGLDSDLLGGYYSTSYDLSIDLGNCGDFGWYVIGILQITDYTLTGNHANGRLGFFRENGNNPIQQIQYSMSTKYNSTDVRLSYIILGQKIVYPCTFTYNGKKWAGFVVRWSAGYSKSIKCTRFGGRVSEKSTPFLLKYYTSNTSTINNSEVYNSIQINGTDIVDDSVSSGTFYCDSLQSNNDIYIDGIRLYKNNNRLSINSDLSVTNEIRFSLTSYTTEYEGGRIIATDSENLYLQGGDSGTIWITSRNAKVLSSLEIKANNFNINGNKIWHAGNDGSGSGMDADLLDGFHRGNSVNNIPTLINFPDFSTISPSASTDDYIDKVLGWAYNNYNAGDRTVLLGCGRPNSVGNILMQLYGGSGIDSEGYPRYSSAILIALNANPRYFGTNDYKFYSKTFAFITDNVASATKLQTARTIWGQSFDGTANVSGSLTGVTNITASGSISCGSLRTTDISGNGSSLYIGNSNNSSYVYLREDMKASSGNWSIPVSGAATFASATINGALTVPYSGGQWISMATRSNIIQANQNQTQSSAHALFRVKSYSGNAVCFGGLGNEVGFYGFYKSRIDSGSNDIDWYTKWNTSDGTLTHKGNLLVTGGGTFYSSDIRAKNVIESLKIKLNDIANAPVIKFKWNGYNDLKDDGKLHIGGIAQYIEKILPECVIGQKDDFLSFDYATTGYVFSVLTARHLLSYETRTDRIIRKLKERIRRLERQLNIENHEEVCIVAD